MGSERRQVLSLSGRSVLAGATGAVALGTFYVIVVAWASGSWQHLVDQMQADWYLLVLVIAGFGTQVALLAELRHRRRREMAAAAASGAGAGASAVGMVACCAHHVADLLPFLGAGGAATFLYAYKVPFVLVGVGINAVGAGIAAHRLRHPPSMQRADEQHEEGAEPCLVA